MKKVAYVVLFFIFSASGVMIGLVTGAVNGQTKETGMVRGAMIGAIAGAVVGMEVLESCFQGELLSKMRIFKSLVNGKIFREYVGPAILKAYQWQQNEAEINYSETADMFDASKNKGLLPENVKKLPEFIISDRAICCAICLQDCKIGESARRLLSCAHFFHMKCIDEWLVRNATCPICRKDV
ncbi:NEP1-interacting protein-like 1 isoform X1 [Dioscorea cayenensis subsp. rotundata]|uniref:NEP1-interacting protein-like 1 isoform X1 n=1 Tax=Dioscorea cayennensis subsp. rotundata TaxID=55577 RepID=A0AB40BR17_DIOCR|nr:NEP1-interacting protein-like 1 isoform X1 [Dioscorea cayenensis subsp. rotundata]